MKIFLIKELPLFSVFFLFSFFSVAQDFTLIGVWQVNFNKTLENMPQLQRGQFEDLSEAKRKEMVDMISSQTFQFDVDNRLKATAQGQTYEGVPELDLAEENLKLIYNAGGEFDVNIIKENLDEIVIRLIEDQASTALFHYLVLERK